MGYVIGQRVICINAEGDLIGTDFPITDYLTLGKEYVISRKDNFSYMTECLIFPDGRGMVYNSNRFTLADKYSDQKDQRIFELAAQLDRANRKLKYSINLLALRTGGTTLFWEECINEDIESGVDLS